MTDREINEACARELGYRPDSSMMSWWHAPECKKDNTTQCDGLYGCSRLPNFLTSDNKNCKLLDAMHQRFNRVEVIGFSYTPCSVVIGESEDRWEVCVGDVKFEDTDRRRAVCMAFLGGGE